MPVLYSANPIPEPSFLNDTNPEFMDNTANNILKTVYGFMDRLDLLFLLMAMLGLVFLLASSSVKQGQWKKTGYGMLIGAYGTLLIIKGFPLFMTVLPQIDFLSESITIVGYLLILWAAINLSMSYSYKMGFVLINHMDYQRLSKNTFFLSIIVFFVVSLISFIV